MVVGIGEDVADVILVVGVHHNAPQTLTKKKPSLCTATDIPEYSLIRSVMSMIWTPL